jgi:hypothetical protein
LPVKPAAACSTAPAVGAVVGLVWSGTCRAVRVFG